MHADILVQMINFRVKSISALDIRVFLGVSNRNVNCKVCFVNHGSSISFIFPYK